MRILLYAITIFLLAGCASKMTIEDLPQKNPQKGGAIIYFLPTDGYAAIYQKQNDSFQQIGEIGILNGRLTYVYAHAKPGKYVFAINPQKGGTEAGAFDIKDGELVTLELKTIWDFKNSMRALGISPGTDKELVRSYSMEFKQNPMLPAKANRILDLDPSFKK